MTKRQKAINYLKNLGALTNEKILNVDYDVEYDIYDVLVKSKVGLISMFTISNLCSDTLKVRVYKRYILSSQIKKFLYHEE